MPDLWKKGDRVIIQVDSRTVEGKMITVEGEIILASSNGVSLMIGFEAILDGHIRMMPVIWEEDGYHSIVTGVAVQLTARPQVH